MRENSAELGDIVRRNQSSSDAITLNQRLNYYDEAVNLAPGLEGQGDVGDITISATLCEYSTISTILQTHEPVHRLASMKGFDNPITMARINLQATHDRKY